METQLQRTAWIMAIAQGLVIIPDAPVAGDYDNSEDDDNTENDE